MGPIAKGCFGVARRRAMYLDANLGYNRRAPAELKPMKSRRDAKRQGDEGDLQVRRRAGGGEAIEQNALELIGKVEAAKDFLMAMIWGRRGWMSC